MPPINPTFDQLVVWTAVPNGTVPGDPNTLQISVAVSPRLTILPSSSASQELGRWKDWLNWPATEVTFTVRIGTVTIPSTSVRVLPPSVPLPSGVTSQHMWQLLFDSSTPVTPYEFSSYAGKFIRSYPAYNVQTFLQKTYTQIASQFPTDYPTYQDLIGPPGGLPQLFGQLPTNTQTMESTIETINGELRKSGGAIPPGAPVPGTDVVQAWLYSQPLYTPPAGSEGPSPEPLQPDFHQMVSSLGKYPVLLRALHLVRDLQVALPSGLPAQAPLSVTATWTPLLTGGVTQNALPAIQTEMATFRAAPRSTNPLIDNGLLRLSDHLASGAPTYPLIEVDLDGSAMKALNFAQAITNAVEVLPSLNTTAQTQYSVPSLRSSGITLVHTGTAAEFASDQTGEGTINSALESHSPVTLYAEDVTQGYRIDVFDHTADHWYQLCARVAAGTVYGAPAPTGYVIGTGGSAVVQPLPGGNPGTPGPGPGETGAPFDEGWVELSLTHSPPWVTPASDLYLHEKLLRWNGWSLIADRPGQHVAEKSNTPSPNTFNKENPTALPLRASHAAAPGTLPLLRFGRSYRLRARAVDVAGNSLDFPETPPSLAFASPPITYGRMEPIQTPIPIPAAPRTPGEHLLNVVIRSETYSTPPASVTPNVRHIVPPSLAAEMAEHHGLFDVDGVPSGSAATYNLIKDSVGLTFATPSVVSSLGGVFDSSWVNSLWPESLYYYPAPNLACPYLPELFARGASLQDLPGAPANTPPLTVPFSSGSPWPAVEPLSIIFNSGTAAPSLVTSSSGNQLNVYAPPGTITTSRLSAYLDAGDLGSMGLWLWLEAAGLSNATLQDAITSGQHWMFTPYEEVTFVHAVRTPNPPGFVTSGSGVPEILPREPGKTYALFSGTVDVDFLGSNKLDLLSEWTIPFDDGVNLVQPQFLVGSSHLADVPLELADPVPQSIALDNVRHDFGDTKYRQVNYTAQATSRYLEYFQEFTSVVLTTTPTTINAGGLASGATVVSATLTTGSPPTTETVTFQPLIDYIEVDTAGTLQLTTDSSIPTVVGPTGSVDVRYVAPPVTNVSAPASLAVVSTAAPATPDIAYVLPIFAFDTASASGVVTSTRIGNALRIYLNRPWWSSGGDEQLGVVVYPGTGAPPATVAPLISGYGRDPLRNSNLVSRQPNALDFTLAAQAPATGITLQETSASTVSIAGHSVQWEGTNHFLWYADVAIDSAVFGAFSYFPFIRLALVRYQPNSLPGYEISRVKLADFIQVAPNRFASLSYTPGGTTVSVTVTGVGASASSQIGVPPSAMTVRVQTKVAGVTDPDLQWVDDLNSEISLEATESPDHVFTWTGTLTLPAVQGSKPQRIRISELEYYLYEPFGGSPTYASRVVYLDTLEI